MTLHLGLWTFKIFTQVLIIALMVRWLIYPGFNKGAFLAFISTSICVASWYMHLSRLVGSVRSLLLLFKGPLLVYRRVKRKALHHET